MQTKQNYQSALDAAQKGYLISREGWNGKGLRVFVQVPSEVPETIIPKMSSLPPSAKTLLVQRGGSIRYQKQAALIHPDNTIEGWSPSLSDTMATDWVIHEEPHMDFTAAPVAETAGTAKPVTTFKERVIAEKMELEEKLIKLQDFLNGAVFRTLPPDEQKRLAEQERIMGFYSQLLENRIDADFI